MEIGTWRQFHQCLWTEIKVMLGNLPIRISHLRRKNKDYWWYSPKFDF